MKKFLLGVITICSLCQIFGASEEPCVTCPVSHLKKYYFQPSQMLIDQETIYVLIDDHLVPFNYAGRDDQGYYLNLCEDNDFCPFCGSMWTWSSIFHCCLNPPSKCPASCQTKTRN